MQPGHAPCRPPLYPQPCHSLGPRGTGQLASCLHNHQDSPLHAGSFGMPFLAARRHRALQPALQPCSDVQKAKSGQRTLPHNTLRTHNSPPCHPLIHDVLDTCYTAPNIKKIKPPLFNVQSPRFLSSHAAHIQVRLNSGPLYLAISS